MARKRKKYTVYFDNIRAKKVFEIIKLEWDRREKSGVFHGLVLPQDNYISSDLSGRELALFFFYAVLAQRGSIDSDSPMRIWWRYRQRVPEAFDPAIIVNSFSPEKIFFGLRETIGIEKTNKQGFKLKEISEFWIHNSKELLNFWDGDPRNLFSGVSDFRQVFEKIKRKEGKTVFRGMGMKVFTLLTIYLQEREIIPIFPTPLPVDFHTLRVLWTTGIIKRSDWIKPCSSTRQRSQQLIGKPKINIYYDFPNKVAIWSQRFMEKNEFSHLEMNPAIWLLSRSLCSKHFQNISKDQAHRYVDAIELRKNPSLWPKNYRNPCICCPIESYCKWIIPSAPYWRWGLLVKLGKRVSYPKN